MAGTGPEAVRCVCIARLDAGSDHDCLDVSLLPLYCIDGTAGAIPMGV